MEDKTAMDALQIELAKLRRDANLSQSIQDVDKIIQQLENARETIASGMAAFLHSIWNLTTAFHSPCNLAHLLTLYVFFRSQLGFYHACKASKSSQERV